MYAARSPSFLTRALAVACVGCATTWPSPPPPPRASFSPPAASSPASHPPQTASPAEAAGDHRPEGAEAAEPVLPHPRKFAPGGVLELSEVLESVDQTFPLLVAAEQERVIASGRRLSAAGAFDLNLRARGFTQGGTFPNERLDVAIEQPTMLYGTNLFAGYRFGFGDFPVYYGDRKTADGGEFRAGVQVPLLRGGPIDPRRATLRQARIAEALAEPVVQRARIDYLQAAARAYWNWVAAGAQYHVSEDLLQIARDRQAGLEEQLRRGQIAEFAVIDNRRLIVEREGNLIAAERRLQQTAFDLSLYLRGAEGNPVVPEVNWLPRGFARKTPPPPEAMRLPHDMETAYRLRPELQRFGLLRERATVELRLAENQTYPTLNAALSGSQDMGKGKEGAGIFELERSVLEAALLFEVPLQRREARGRVRAAQGTLMQLLAQERFARDKIGAEVLDAISNLDRTYERLQRAREEQRIARRVAELERERFRRGQGTLLEVNLRELAAAGARAKVIEALADYFRAYADYRAALGLDAVAGHC